MAQKIKAGAVSYLNTKPLIYGFEQGKMHDELELLIDYPAKIAAYLQTGQIDIGLVPVAVIPSLSDPHIISDYCIGCDGEVASVCLFSDVPLHEVKTVLLDYQSRTSVELLQLLLKEYWHISPELVSAGEDYEKDITGDTAGLVIGDRAFKQRKINKYFYDLGLAWKDLTGMPFVFAAWVSNRKLPEDFIQRFNAANAYGFEKMDDVLKNNPYEDFDLKSYYTDFVKFKLDDRKQAAKALFLSKINRR